MKILIRQASTFDIPFLKLRDIDLKEIQAMSGNSPFEALRRGIVEGRKSWSVFGQIDGKFQCIAIFGVCDYPGYDGVGCPWLLASDALAEIPMTILRASKKFLAEMHQDYPVLCNFVHHENTTSINWLKWLGFSVLPPITLGVQGDLFHQFIRKNNV